MLTSLYLNTATQMRKDEIMQRLQSASEEEKVEAMKQIVAQMSRGEDFTSLTYRITKETLTVKSNELKRLFYYYLELVPKGREDESFGEMLLLSNQIRKDLEHPNEYVRGFVMRFVSTLEDEELVGNFYRLVRDNFNHPNAYVRRNAYFCLGEVFCRMPMYTEVPDLLYNSLFRDLDPNCLRQAFVSLYRASPSLALRYVGEMPTSIPTELSTAIIDGIREPGVVSKFLDSEDTVAAFEAAIAMHRTCVDVDVLRRSTDVILKCMDEVPEYREYAIDELGSSGFSFSGYATRFLCVIDAYDVELCRKCLEFIFKISETHEFLQICDFLCYKFMGTSDVSVQHQSFRIVLLEKMARFADIYSTYSEEMVEESLRNVTSSNPTLAYSSLEFLSSCFNVMRAREGNERGSRYETCLAELVEKVNGMRYGKILRYGLEILRQNMKRGLFEKVMEVFDRSFEQGEMPLYLRDTQPFLGSFICIELCEMYMKVESDVFKERIITIMLKFISHGKRNESMDQSSHSTIISCIRSVLCPRTCDVVAGDEHKIHNVDVLAPVVCGGVPRGEDSGMEKLEEFLQSEENGGGEIRRVIQLTGLSDPIYVEATASYSRFEVTLDMVFINQTPSYLQNILLDFVTSGGLVASFVNVGFSLSGRSVVSKRLTFRIVDASNGFIGGSMTFKYPDESGEYANTTYRINLSEVRTCISSFLEPGRMCEDSFREMWRGLEWENTYTLKFVSEAGVDEIVQGICKGVNGAMVSVECDENYGVGNIVCSTLQNLNVLVNVCVWRGEYMHFECRIRSKRESIVKSVSTVVGESVRRFKSK